MLDRQKFLGKCQSMYAYWGNEKKNNMLLSGVVCVVEKREKRKKGQNMQ